MLLAQERGTYFWMASSMLRLLARASITSALYASFSPPYFGVKPCSVNGKPDAHHRGGRKVWYLRVRERLPFCDQQFGAPE